MSAPIPAPRRQVGEAPSPGRGYYSSGTHHAVCLVWVQDYSRLCCLPAKHTGTHLAFPNWPAVDISPSNPGTVRRVVA